MHFESPSDPSQTAAIKGKPRYICLIIKLHSQSFRRQVRLLLSKAKPSYIYSIFKPHNQSSKSPVRPLLSEGNLSYVYSILKPHGQTSRSSDRLILVGVRFHIFCKKTDYSKMYSIHMEDMYIILYQADVYLQLTGV